MVVAPWLFEVHAVLRYDTVYLASTELQGCELWTAAARLVHPAGGRFPWIHTPRSAARENARSGLSGLRLVATGPEPPAQPAG